MAKSHPAMFDSAPSYTQWARNTVAGFVLLACLVSLAIILNDQFGARVTATVAHRLAALDLTQLVPEVETAPAVADDPNTGMYRVVGEYLARRYRVSLEVTTDIVSKAYAIGQELKLDPMLILAVIAVESRFNPIAESAMGAKGLMQIIPRYHPDKFDPLGGEKVAFDPQANIIVGARILKDYIRYTGDLGDALQMYVGATSEENENGYSSKIMLERDRISEVLRQYQAQNRIVQQHLSARSLGAST